MLTRKEAAMPASRAVRYRLAVLRLLLLLLSLLSAIVEPVYAKVFYARNELPKLAFPDADRVEPHDYILTSAQREAIEKEAHAKLDSNLLTVYIGHKADGVNGYAFVDTHVVRTLPETFMVVLTPDGAVAATHVLAFYEPLEYLPSDRWLEQLKGRRLSDSLKVGDEIAAITGSSLSSNAVVGGVRRALAAYHVLIACASSSPESGPATDCSK